MLENVFFLFLVQTTVSSFSYLVCVATRRVHQEVEVTVIRK